MASQKKSGLGRGLDALFSDIQTESKDSVMMIPVSSITPNPRQPRTEFSEEELADLAASIKEHGVIQPLIVSEEQLNGQYILIAGERRLRASQLAGLTTVPAITRSADDKELLELALIENIQRENLSPLDTAEAYRYLETTFNMTHEEISQKVGKNRVSVTNTLRLLKLAPEVRAALSEKKISEGHARVLLSLPTEQAQVAAMNHVVEAGLNVRQTEEYVRTLTGSRPDEPKSTNKTKNSLTPELQNVEEMLRRIIGTKVSLRPTKNGAGTINIHYYSNEELESIIKKLGNE